MKRRFANADYRVRSRMADVAREESAASLATFQPDELKVLIETAHYYGLKIAAHASSAQAMRMAAELGIDSIEHGHSCSDPAVFKLMQEKGVTYVPTLGAYYTVGRDGRSGSGGTWAGVQRAFELARKAGVKIACGGDTGVFSHGANALEMSLMHELGVEPKEVLAWATVGGWECVRPKNWEEAFQKIRDGLENTDSDKKRRTVGRDELGDNAIPFGIIRRGFAADIVASALDVEGDFRNAIQATSISFVMKMGKIYKHNGKSLA